MVGGYNGSPLATVEVYDPATNTWSQAPPMGTVRSAPGMAVLGGKLYAAGGNYSALSSVAVFAPQTNAWTALAPMITARDAFAMTAVQGKLYAVGGSAAGSTLATAEAFDPQQNRWEAVAPMAQARRSCASVRTDYELITKQPGAWPSFERFDWAVAMVSSRCFTLQTESGDIDALVRPILQALPGLTL